jgi:hypothetical protein
MNGGEISPTTPQEKIEDIEMIDSRVKELASRVFEEKKDEYQDIDELVDEVFSLGIVEILTSDHEVHVVEEEFLAEDEFKYRVWQLNLCKHVKDTDTEWVNLKSMILRQGLKKISEEVLTG